MSSTRKSIQAVVDRSKTTRLAASKRARKARTANEFDLRSLIPTLRSPVTPTGAWSWTLEEIMNGRDAQQNGQFVSAVRLAESLRTDDAAFAAIQNRLAPQENIGVEMQEGKGPRAGAICKEADALFGPTGIGITPETLTDIARTRADHGIAIGVNIWTPRPDGSRIDVELKSWPLEFVFWHSAARCLVTRVDPQPTIDDAASLPGLPRDHYGTPRLPSNLVPITPGDGRWVLFANSDFMPWRHDAALLSAAMVYAAHAYAIRDWAKNSGTHGSAKIVGELPEGYDLNTAGPEVQAFMALLQDIAASETPFGIKPFGSKVDVLASPSQMHAVFAELALNREKALHRIYCGTDAALGAQGGSPGINVEALFGVSTRIAQGDLRCIERGLYRGTICPWAAVNHGDSEAAPTRKYLVPDTDAGIRNDQRAKQQTSYLAAVGAIHSAGIPLTQQILDDQAGAFGAKPIVLPVAGAAASPASTAPLSVVR